MIRNAKDNFIVEPRKRCHIIKGFQGLSAADVSPPDVSPLGDSPLRSFISRV